MHFLLRFAPVLLSVALFSLPGVSGAAPPAKPPELTAAQKERLKERDKYGELAAKYRQQGKLAEAIAAAEKMLAIEREVFGNVHEEVAGSLEQLAEMHEQREDFAAARKARQEVLAIRTKLHGEKHWQVTDARLALTHVDLLAKLRPEQRRQLNEANQLDQKRIALYRQGKYREAIPLAPNALEIRKKVLGPEHPDTARSLHELGVLLNLQGDHAAARPYLEQALAICKKVLGPEHPHTATSLNNLGYHEQALAIRKKVLGPEHPDTATSLNNLGGLLHSQRDYAAARPYYEQALAICKKVLGPEHANTATSLNNLGALLQEQGDYAAARPYHEQALAIAKKVLGPEHPDTARGLNHLGELLRQQGDYAAARPYYEQALAIAKKVLGSEHPQTAISLNNLGLLLQAQGDYAAARPYLEQALAINLKKVLGPEHPETANSLNNLGGLLHDQGHNAAARPYFEQALAIWNKVLGPEHPRTAASVNNLGVLLGSQGDYAAALPYLERALAIRKKVLGSEHPDTAGDYRNLAHALHAQGRHSHAEETATAAAESFQAARLRISFGGLERTRFAAEHSPLPLLAALLARNGKPLLAWQRLEENLARGLLDDLGARQRLAREERDRLTSLLGRLQKLDERIAALMARRADAAPLASADDARRKKIDELRKERDGLQLELTQFQAELEKKHGPAAGEVYGLARIQALLPADAALVTWLDLKAPPKADDPNGEHWGFVVRKSGDPVCVRLADSGPDGRWTEDDDALPRQVYEQVHRPPADPSTDWQELTKKLTAQRLAPLQEHLARGGRQPPERADTKPAELGGLTPPTRQPVKHLIILHSDFMAGIPIEALTDRYSISYAPSGTMFAWLQEKRDAKSPAEFGLLALGDPVFERKEPPRPTDPLLPEHGVLVTMVQPGGNAAQAGIKLGDVFLRYDSRKLAALADLDTAIKAVSGKQPASGTRSDTGIPVELWRDGKMIKLAVQPGRLGVGLSKESAPVAIRASREADEKLRLALRGESFVPLPGTRREVEAIAGLFTHQTSKVEKLLGSDASEQKLDRLAKKNRLQQFRYLHFATHGKTDRSGGLNSFLALAQDKLPDPLASGLSPGGRGAADEGEFYTGRLTAERIARTWSVDADLVTLSACETGLGEKAGGEGYKGFSQALFLAGAHSLVLSMWKVADRATALFMTRFYQNLLGARRAGDVSPPRPMSKTAALTEAKRWLRNLSPEEAERLRAELPDAGRAPGSLEAAPPAPGLRPYEHPYYWSAFILVGDPGDVTDAVPVLAETPPPAVTPALTDTLLHFGPWLALAGVVLVLLVACREMRRRHRRSAM